MFLFKQLVGLSWYEFVQEALLSWEPGQLGRMLDEKRTYTELRGSYCLAAPRLSYPSLPPYLLSTDN